MSLPRYPAYKDSGVSWLGEVPAHWDVDRIKASVGTCRNGIWGDEAQGDLNDIPCVRVADFDRVRFCVKDDIPTIRSVTDKERQGRLLQQGDLLLEKSGGGDLQPVGQVVEYRHSTPAVCSNFVARMSLREGMVSGYWVYFHAAAYAVGLNIGSINQTSGIQNLDQDRYFNERAPFPPAVEQTAIFRFLDRETAKIDALIAEQEKLIVLLAEKRQATISRAVTRGLDPNVPLKDSGIPWLGKVPAHWTVSRLKQIVRPGVSVSYGIVQPGDPLDDGVPFIQTSNLSDASFELHQLQRTTLEISSAYPRSQLSGGEVILGIRASIGAAFVVPEHLKGANLSRGIARIECGDAITSEYLVYVLRSSSTTHYWGLAKQGSTFNEVSIETVRELAFSVPPLSEQAEIAKFLQSELPKLDRLVGDAMRAVELFKERRAALISAAVTGKIDVRGLAA